jgi:hypothetical protein
MPSAQLSQVLTTARTYLNDDNIAVWSDPTLIPKVQEAHRELQTELWVNGSPIVRAQSSILSIPTSGSVTNLGTLNPSGYPTDLLLPTALSESTASPVTWQPITETIYFPIGYLAQVALTWWSWQEENILLAPCSSARSIIVQYRRSIPIPVVATDLIGILFGEIYLAPRAAAIAAGSVGNKATHDEMTALAKSNFGKLLVSNRGQQRSLMGPGAGYGSGYIQPPPTA